jgi:hypothetical protein
MFIPLIETLALTLAKQNIPLVEELHVRVPRKVSPFIFISPPLTGLEAFITEPFEPPLLKLLILALVNKS